MLNVALPRAAESQTGSATTRPLLAAPSPPSPPECWSGAFSSSWLRRAGSCVRGAVINVFGPRGWGMPTDYEPWQPPRAHPGDLLNFTYVPDNTGHHNVWLMASKKAYKSCDFTGGILLGNTTHVMLRLNRPGRYYFACSTISVSSHCQNGQKFSIRVFPGQSLAHPRTVPGTPRSILGHTRSL